MRWTLDEKEKSPLYNELTHACLNGPRALQSLLTAKWPQLMADMNVLNEVLSAIVYRGAHPNVLTALATHLLQLDDPTHPENTTNAITQLILLEHDLDLQFTEGGGYVRRGPDSTLRRTIAAVIEQALELMPDFDVEQRIQFYRGRY